VGVRGRTAVAALLVVPLLACSAPSQQEYDVAMARFDALSDEAKAYVCADDWYAVQYGIEGFVLVERCAAGREQPVTGSQALSRTFEDADQRYARDYYRRNPPTARQLRDVDPAALCEQDAAEVRVGIEQWRQSTDFPAWNGVAYVPSLQHEVARLQIWSEAACPLLPG
jgi:capsid protein